MTPSRNSFRSPAVAGDCPFCRLAAGEATARNRLDDVVWRDERTLAFVSPRWWPPTEGNAIVVPLKHVENLYAISDEDLSAVYATVQRVAVAMRESYDCDGISRLRNCFADVSAKQFPGRV